MDVTEVEVESVQPELVQQALPSPPSTSNPGHAPMKTYEELLKENEDLKNQLKTSVPLEKYQFMLDQKTVLKKELATVKAERNRLKSRNETLEQRFKVRKKGQDLSKKAKHLITREVMGSKLSTAELDCYLNNQTKSTKWSNQGRQILHMLTRVYFRENELKARSVRVRGM